MPGLSLGIGLGVASPAAGAPYGYAYLILNGQRLTLNGNYLIMKVTNG